MSADSHQEIIRKVYYNVSTGFGSIAKTLAEAKKVNSLITADEVKLFLSKQEHKQTKKRRTDNSWIPFGPREEFQIDLADFGTGGEYRFAFMAIDIFTKKLVVIPIKDKTSESTSKAMDGVLAELDVPTMVYTDDGHEFRGTFEAKLKEYAIEHVISRTPATFVERAIRTLRDGITARLDALRLENTNWWKMVPHVVSQYNSSTHTTTKSAPNDAAKLGWEGDRGEILKLRGEIEEKAHKNREYPKISVGDKVKILRKPGKYGEFKSNFAAWTRETFTVTKIANQDGSPVFYLEGRASPLRLHEILKVEAVEKAPRYRVVGKHTAETVLEGKRGPPPQPARRRITGKTFDPNFHPLGDRIFG
jgi:hypothetical protein